MEDQIQKKQEFFSFHALIPTDRRAAIDLRAGCRFQSVALAALGYSVTAVDFCQPLLDANHYGPERYPYLSLVVRPAPIVCIGDTLTHLADPRERRGPDPYVFQEPDPGGRLVLTLRDYSHEPEGAVVVIPVERDNNRIFLLQAGISRRYAHRGGHSLLPRAGSGRGRPKSTRRSVSIRTRSSGCSNDAGFGLEYSAVDNGMITVIARKGA